LDATPAIASTASSPHAERTPTAVFFLLPVAIGYYGFLLTAAGNIPLFAPLPHGLTFNSMLLHLLQGRFDVDPAAIGHEGYLRDGAVYSYFGVFPALLRAPLLVLPDFAATELTRISCLLAVSLMAVFKVMSALVVWRSAGAPRDSLLLTLLVAVILLAGPQIQFLRPSIFVESVFWSGALAAVFVYLVLRGWTSEGGFSVGLLCGLALVSGLCLLTRVSTGVGLCVAFGLVWLWQCWSEFRLRSRFPSKRWLALALPGVVLLLFAGAAGLINYQRWGDPLAFVDLSRALMLEAFPERAERLREYGAFNPIRLGFGLIYYFLPVWVLRDGSGQLLWADFVNRTIDSAELPPSTFLISDPLILGLAVYGAVGLVRRSLPNRMPICLAAAGFLIPIGLMLTAISMTFRYRMEFYPLFELLSFAGCRRLLARPTRGTLVAVGAGAVASIVAANALWLVSAMSPFGPAVSILGNTGIAEFYLH
jgi:hypothetical protein